MSTEKEHKGPEFPDLTLDEAEAFNSERKAFRKAFFAAALRQMSRVPTFRVDSNVGSTWGELQSGPGWGKVVSRDHRVREPEPDYAGVNGPSLVACAPENACEAKTLFEGLLHKKPETETTHAFVCSCGRIGRKEDLCRPVSNVKVPKTTKYLRLTPRDKSVPEDEVLYYLPRSEQRKVAERWNQEGTEFHPDGLDGLAQMVYAGVIDTTVSDTYK